jgi:type III pantothenate kinase
LLLAIDVGNTQTVVGLYDGELLAEHWRVASVRTQTADELAVELHGLLSVRGRGFGDVTATVASSGVPQLAEALRQTARTHFGHEALVVGQTGVETGLELRVPNPQEVGADRVANSVAALALQPGPLVVVDFGIELRAPERAIGRTTAENMQSGAIFGYAGLVDGLVGRFRTELGGNAGVIATGGLAALVAPHCLTIDRVEPWLTLEGLRRIWLRNTTRSSE